MPIKNSDKKQKDLKELITECISAKDRFKTSLDKIIEKTKSIEDIEESVVQMEVIKVKEKVNT